MTITQIINKITSDIINPLIILLFALATAIFVWGIIQYVLGSAGSPQQTESAKKTILWGVIGMFVMASAWGLVNLLCEFFLGSLQC